MALLCLALALFPSLFGWLVAALGARASGPPALLLSPRRLGGDRDPARAHAVPLLLVPARLQPAANLPGSSRSPGSRAVYGVSFLVAGVSAALAYLALEKRAAGPRGRVGARDRRRRGAVWHPRRLAPRPALPETGRIAVGLVQASIRQDEKWDPELALENVERHVDADASGRRPGRAARGLAGVGRARSCFDHNLGLAEQLRGLAAERCDLPALRQRRPAGPAGRPLPRVGRARRCSTPQGDLALRYHKIRLVPFGEYVPMQPLLTLGGRFAAKLVRQVADFTPGEEHSTGQVDGHRVGAFICYEAIFPDLVRHFSAPTAPSSWSTSPTTPGTAAARRPTSTWRWPPSARWRTRSTWCGRPTPASRRWSTRGGASLERTDALRPATLVRDVRLRSRAPPSTRATATSSPGAAWSPPPPSPLLAATTLRYFLTQRTRSTRGAATEHHG